ncbi:energy transducer TonB [Azospirillum sp.]|uniref:energy transducer TonB n=1 Tax=Azospirillum sp. TaxID=34012 RepID=UPI002D28DEC2|nr:energy transducer TonB [Azospirillum sp.]HYD70221.1 energy transducer TonB [Azospirillum sp.]
MRRPLRWLGRRWAPVLSVAVHAALFAVLVARHEPAPAAPAPIRVELELSQPEPAAETQPVEPTPEPLQVAEPLPPELPPPEPEPVAANEPPPPVAEEPPPAPEPVVTAMVPPPPVKPRPPDVARRPPPTATAAAPREPALPVPQPAPQQPAAAPVPVRAAGPPPDYLALLQARLARHKVYPRAAQLAREEGTVLLRFVVTRDGAVVSWRIERGSGFESLDRQVGIMIERAAPLPPLPDSVPGDRLEIVLPVRFALR